MWDMIPSLAPLVECLRPVFTPLTYTHQAMLLIAWVMCLGSHTLLRVARTAHPNCPPDNSQRHGLDSYYNFFEP